MPHQLPLTFGPAEKQRLGRQCQAIAEIMSDGNWFTLQELEHALQQRGIAASQAGISARLRDLRRSGRQVDCESRIGKLYHYKLT